MRQEGQNQKQKNIKKPNDFSKLKNFLRKPKLLLGFIFLLNFVLLVKIVVNSALKLKKYKS